MEKAKPEPRAAQRLTRPQKAAVVVRLLLGEGVDPGLAELPEDLQGDLVMQMAGMHSVDQTTLAQVATEFAEAVGSVGLAFRPGLAGALGTLGKAISPVAAERFRRQLGPDAQGNPWTRVGELAADDLLPILAAESTEVAAVILSKLKVSRAAELLGRLPGSHARRVAYAMSLTEAVDPALVVRIGRAILDQIDSRPVPAFSEGPVERVGAILNFSPSATRDQVLRGLDETDQDFADEVRKAIFTFANIPARIDPRDVARIVRAVDQKALVAALAAASARGLDAPAEFILANMSQRLAAQLREEMAAHGPMKERAADEAMSAVVARIRELAGAGEIFLVAGEE